MINNNSGGTITVNVSIHAPAWGATCWRFLVIPRERFQSTHPRGVRQCSNTDQILFQGFNPRTRVGCDCIPRNSPSRKDGFQSTHPRGVRQFGRTGCAGELHVSIHAPAWGATVKHGCVGLTFSVSIHAPAWGATDYKTAFPRVTEVSIHAPAWGATKRLMG